MTDLNPSAVAHASRCGGFPIFERSGHEWSAWCSQMTTLVPCPDRWEVTGCESRAEAGAAFYGHDPRGEL